MRNFFAFISKEKEFLSTVFIFVYDFQYLGSSVSSRRERESSKSLLWVIEKDIILWRVPLSYKVILRMTAIKSMHSLSNLKYVGIFDYIEDAVRIWTI